MMKNLAYHEADEASIKEALDLYQGIYEWWLTAHLTTEPERKLAHKNIASARRLKESIKP
jgi:hypothetical protein